MVHLKCLCYLFFQYCFAFLRAKCQTFFTLVHIEYTNASISPPVGFPNVGKSSVINSLVGRKVVSVSRTPGHTKYFQTYYLTPTVKLCDCPGLVFPSRVDKQLQVLTFFGAFCSFQLTFQCPHFGSVIFLSCCCCLVWTATQRSPHFRVDIRCLLCSLSLASLPPDPGRHLPGVSTAGALQLSGLPVPTGAVPVCAQAQASQLGGGRASARRPEAWGAELDGLGRVWRSVRAQQEQLHTFCVNK